ncbi:unnamed protein product [Protopolystoma xenopodis]|uniref:Uncharacterized protein n=1 Tax=Protopolystoma xenopodis TaxID=117903 RepID=A0A3S5B9C7_9PLAT|nr:unnamed protein product [Protopolystoma xenopodis]
MAPKSLDSPSHNTLQHSTNLPSRGSLKIASPSYVIMSPLSSLHCGYLENSSKEYNLLSEEVGGENGCGEKELKCARSNSHEQVGKIEKVITNDMGHINNRHAPIQGRQQPPLAMSRISRELSTIQDSGESLDEKCIKEVPFSQRRPAEITSRGCFV